MASLAAGTIAPPFPLISRQTVILASMVVTDSYLRPVHSVLGCGFMTFVLSHILSIIYHLSISPAYSQVYLDIDVVSIKITPQGKGFVHCSVNLSANPIFSCSPLYRDLMILYWQYGVLRTHVPYILDTIHLHTYILTYTSLALCSDLTVMLASITLYSFSAGVQKSVSNVLCLVLTIVLAFFVRGPKRLINMPDLENNNTM